MDTLHSIAKNKKQLAQEKEEKKMERELITYVRAAKNKNKENLRT